MPVYWCGMCSHYGKTDEIKCETFIGNSKVFRVSKVHDNGNWLVCLLLKVVRIHIKLKKVPGQVH